MGLEGAVVPGVSGEMQAAASVPTELGLPQELGRAVAGAESSQNSARQTWQEGSEGMYGPGRYCVYSHRRRLCFPTGKVQFAHRRVSQPKFASWQHPG